MYYRTTMTANQLNIMGSGVRASLPFSSPRVLSTKRIGPHNFDVLSIFMGSLLGDGTMEMDGNGSRFAFYQEKTHGEYLLWLHKTLFDLGYCKPEIPSIQTRLSADGINFRYIYRFRTYTYSSFNWIYDYFYIKNGGSHLPSTPGANGLRRKVVPPFISDYLSPLALAVWIMDDGCKIENRGLRFSTNCFTLSEVKFLASILSNKYGLVTSIHKTGDINQYNVYVNKSSSEKLAAIVRPLIHPSMLYKI